VDSLHAGQALCGVKILSPANDNTLVRQPDSLVTSLEVGLFRDGTVRRLSSASPWKWLTTSGVLDFQAGDVLIMRFPEQITRTRSYKVISLRPSSLTKEAPKPLTGDLLTSHALGFTTYPNPFNPTTQLTFVLAEPSRVSLTVHDILGREVARLTDGFHQAGYHTVTWNAQNAASGLYFARLTATNELGRIVYSKTNKLLLTR
ncbi:MAG TPA: T9SS type A sorting domain-containing protein, partial [Bacteroidota bacterium]